MNASGQGAIGPAARGHEALLRSARDAAAQAPPRAPRARAAPARPRPGVRLWLESFLLEEAQVQAPPAASRAVELLRLDHLGIAVGSLGDARALWEARLGLKAAGVEEVPSQRVRVAFLPLPGAKLELLEATAPESPIARHLAKRGPGLHHVAFEVRDIRAAMRDARERGMPPLSGEPARGAGGRLVCFLHPRDAGGVLVELVQAAGL